jgi:hypothetical protein
MRAVVKIKDAGIRCEALDSKSALHTGKLTCVSDSLDEDGNKIRSLVKGKTYRLRPETDFNWNKGDIFNLFIGPSMELAELGQCWGPTLMLTNETPCVFFKPRKNVELEDLDHVLRLVVVE